MTNPVRSEVAGVLREARAIGLGVETNRKLDDAISAFENNTTERETMETPLDTNTELELRVAFARGVEAMKNLTAADLIADEDPCMPIRNLAGHIVSCNYGDWADFTKCKCAEGLLNAPEQKTAFVVAPMPLRDILASSIQVSDEMAHELAMGIRVAQKEARKIETIGEVLGVTDEEPLTVIELADARAKIRYLEADAMIAWRAESLRINAEAKTGAAKRDEDAPRVCRCGHNTNNHDQISNGQFLGCATCPCVKFRHNTQAEPPRIVVPSSGDPRG